MGILNILQRFRTKKNSIFLLFVLGVTVFWFINKLSKDYQQSIVVEVDYSNLPKKLILQEQPVQKIDVRIKASGFYFFKRAFTNKKITVSLKDVVQKNNYDYYLSNINILKQFKRQFNKTVLIEEVLLNQLDLKLGQKTFKKVPVVSNNSLSFALGYNSIKGVKISPDSIEVSGPEMQVNKVSQIKLLPYKNNNIDASLSSTIDIIKPNIPKLSFNVDKVDLELTVEKMTEKTLMIPVKLTNSSLQEVVVFPKKVKVSFQLSLSDFNKVNVQDFTLIADFKNRGDQFIGLEMINGPQNIFLLKLENESVEYLILK